MRLDRQLDRARTADLVQGIEAAILPSGSQGFRQRLGGSAAGLAEHMGDDPLSEHEVVVLRHVVGNRNREIADLLFIAEQTVKVHLQHIMNKLGANDRTQSVVIAARRGIIHLYSR